jgi:hypothetical protein
MAMTACSAPGARKRLSCDSSYNFAVRRSLTITDARGATLQLWGGGGPESALESLSPTERKRFREVVWPDELKLTGKVTKGTLLFLTGATIVPFVAVLIVTLLGPALPRYALSFALGFGMFMWTCIFLRLQVRRVPTSPLYVSHVLDLGRCPACLYQLAGQVAEPDGCVVCPECGGAWRQPVD